MWATSSLVVLPSRFYAPLVLSCLWNIVDVFGGSKVPLSSVIEEFEKLWEVVAVKKSARNHGASDAPVKQVCQYGINAATMDVTRFLLSQVSPPIDQLEVNYAGDSHSLFYDLKSEFGERVQNGSRHEPYLDKSPHAPSQVLSSPKCDFVLFSGSAPWFTIERMLPHIAEQVLVTFISFDCSNEESEFASPDCDLGNRLWTKTALMRRGYCFSSVCMSLLPADILSDPHILTLDCPKFISADGSNASSSEFGQDWFYYWNFVRSPARDGVYVDVGASLPFDYSNTVVLDRCLGWSGVCVEPNPRLVSYLKAYRNCKIFPYCVHDETVQNHSFSDRDGVIAFATDCLPLAEILNQAGLRGRRIDLLSVDVENGELRVFKNFPFDDYDIRVIIVEVGQGARWLEIDTVILPKGYAKVAIMGRDAVYAKLEELSAFADWPFLKLREAALPSAWHEFHHRVVEEELEDEMRRERIAFYAGQRKR